MVLGKINKHPFLILLAATSLAGSLSAQEFFDGHEVVPREAIVKFRDGLGLGLNRAIAVQDLEIARPAGRTGAAFVRSRSKNVRTLLNEFRANPLVEYAEPNYVIRAIATPNDTRFAELWGLRNTGQTILGIPGLAGAHISAANAWDITTGNRNTVVGIVDTGIDYNHPDLAANIWSAPSAFTVNIRGVIVNCAAGTHGFNAINNTCNPLDDNNHGTHVAGTIGAVGNDGQGVAGVNWTASMMGLKFLAANGSGSTADAIDAIEFAIQVRNVFGAQANVRVLNNSWGGGGFSQALLDEINAANTAGMLFAAAAGNSASNNDLTPHYPSSYSAANIVAVAATTNTDGLASFSSYGATAVDIGAPGDNILSTVRNGGYSYFDGTSMATPQVAGAAALILSACSLDTAALKSIILSNADAIASLAGRVLTGGRLNVDRAVRACSTNPNFALSASPSSSSVVAGAGTSYNLSSSVSNGFASDLTLSVAGLPAGATASFTLNPMTAPGTSTMNVATLSSTPAGTYPLVVSATGGGLTRTANVTLVVTAPTVPSFTMSLSPSSRNVQRGASTTYSIAIAPSGGFSSVVSLSVSGGPSGATFSFSPASGTPSFSSVLTVTVPGNATRTTYALTITGTGGGVSRTTTASLRVR